MRRRARSPSMRDCFLYYQLEWASGWRRCFARKDGKGNWNRMCVTVVYVDRCRSRIKRRLQIIKKKKKAWIAIKFPVLATVILMGRRRLSYRA